MLNFLSVDWDYFIGADNQQRLLHFPDTPNENYPKYLQDFIWHSRYADDSEIEKIAVNPLAYKFADMVRYVPKVCVCDSHKYAYTFALMELTERNEKSINLLNIDFHSDWRKDEKDLDCGNWLTWLMKQIKGNYTWLGYKDSYYPRPKELKFLTDFNRCRIDKTKWDVLFICRSDMWSPPHLDEKFTKIFKPIVDSKDGVVQCGIWESRYNLKAIEIQRKMLADFKNQK